jgi:hypothetical protein
MSGGNRFGSLVAALSLSTTVLAADEPLRERFAYAIPIEVPGGAPVVRLDVPLAVYRDSVTAGLRDIRVLNGAGEAVPHAVQPPEAAVRAAAATARLPLFPLRGEAAVSGAPLQLRIDSGETSIQVEGAPSAPAAAPITGYLVVAETLDGAIDEFTFSWPDDTPDFAINAVVATSDDLVNWQVVVRRAPLARLRQAGEVFEQRKVDVPAARARYWRVSAQPGGRLPEITAADATQAMTSIPVERRQVDVAGKAADQPGTYEFDLGAQLPVDRIALALPDVNTVAQVEFFSRRASNDDWRLRSAGAVYRMQSANGELQSAPVAVSPDAARFWRIRVDPRGGGIGSGMPRLQAGWLPDRLVFVTRGGGPFELVYGSALAGESTVPLDRMLPPNADALPLARAGEPREAGGADRLLPPAAPRPWRVWVLWTALLAGVGTLAALAVSLARQMRAADQAGKV